MESYFNKTITNSKCVVIVAHPDDETLWAGGVILSNQANNWEVVATCRKSDSDRNPKFYAAVKALNVEGSIGDMDDGPEQNPLDGGHVEETILSLLGSREYDLIITHSPQGEYTRHRRHEEIGEAVIRLIESGRLKSRALWMFAYSDDKGVILPVLSCGLITLFIWKKIFGRRSVRSLRAYMVSVKQVGRRGSLREMKLSGAFVRILKLEHLSKKGDY